MKSDHRWLLGPDPAPKAEVVGVDGDAAKLEPATPIREITALSQSAQLAETREENIILRASLHGLASKLYSLAGTIEADLARACQGRS